MNLKLISLTLLSVIFVSIGQIIFKYLSQIINIGGGLNKIILFGLIGFLISGFGSLIWIYALRYVSLTKNYSIFGLTFIIVPILSHLIFGEKINYNFIFGSLLIFLGILLINI